MLALATTSKPVNFTPEPIHRKPLVRESKEADMFVKQIWNMEVMLHLLNSKSKQTHSLRGSASDCCMVTLTTCFIMISILLVGLPSQAATYSYPYYKCTKP